MRRFYVVSRRAVLLALLSACIVHNSVGQTPQPSGHARDVYPFLGVDWGGNTFVGAALPFGMVKVGPDMQSFDGRPSGFGYIRSTPTRSDSSMPREVRCRCPMRILSSRVDHSRSPANWT